MSLRSKLLLVALSVLVLPVAGWLFVRQMETLLRDAQAQALVASAEALGRALALRPDTVPAAGPTLFVHALQAPPRLDGHAGDWGGAAEGRSFGHRLDAQALTLTLGRHDERLYAFIDVRDTTPLRGDAHWPNAGVRDHLELEIDGPQGRLGLRLANAGSGALIVTAANGDAAPLRLAGAWLEHRQGYSVELALPQGYAPGALGVAVFDAAAAGVGHRAGTAVDGPEALWTLVGYRAELEQPLRELLPPGVRARMIDGGGWIIAEAGAVLLPEGEREVPWWRRQLYRWMLSSTDAVFDPVADQAPRSEAPEVWQALSGRPASAWRRDADGQRQLLAAAVPLPAGRGTAVPGAIVIERENPTVLLLADQALLRLLGLSLLAFFGTAGVVFVFASRLGWRIRRLRDAAEDALDRDGRVSARGASALHTTSGDEVGDLSRSFARLLDEVGAYTDYLNTLAGKLSHEISTPLAIVRGSLDNIEPGHLDPQARVYIERARGGVDRLNTLVRAMSEATRMERAIADARDDAQRLDLAALVRDCAEAHRPLLAPRRLELRVSDPGPVLQLVPELVAQALDKLLDNARGFCPPDGTVRIAVEAATEGALLRVANTGPLLPDARSGKLFDSLVSLRGRSADDGVHLGFGLYVVRLVAELHRGSAMAANLADGEGVEFTLHLRDVEQRPRGTRPGRGRP